MINGGSPFGGLVQDLPTQWAQQFAAAQQMQQARSSVLDEINKEVAALSSDEQNILGAMKEYQMAKQAYEAGFMSFIGMKFSHEYINTQDGRIAADNLLNTIRRSKDQIKSQVKAKEDKVNTLLELMENDPEIKKRLDEVMLSKCNK